MKKIFTLVLLSLSFQTWATLYTFSPAGASGNWSNPANWLAPNGYPGVSGNNHIIVIAPSKAINFDVSVSFTSTPLRFVMGSSATVPVASTVLFGDLEMYEFTVFDVDGPSTFNNITVREGSVLNINNDLDARKLTLLTGAYDITVSLAPGVTVDLADAGIGIEIQAPIVDNVTYTVNIGDGNVITNSTSGGNTVITNTANNTRKTRVLINDGSLTTGSIVMSGGVYGRNSLEITGEATVNVNGNLMLTTFLCGQSTFVFTHPTNSQTIQGTPLGLSALTFYNMQLNGDATNVLNIEDADIDRITILGTIEINGKNLNLTGTDTVIIGATSATEYGQVIETGLGGTIAQGANAKLYMEKAFAVQSEGWRHIGLPLASNLSLVTGVTKNVTPGQENIFWFNTAASSLHSGRNRGWKPVSNLAANTSTKAFGLYFGPYHPITSGNGKITVGGTYFKSNVNHTVTALIDSAWDGISYPQANATGWNFIPNPYPCNLSVSDILSELTDQGISYRAVHIWDSQAGQYVAMTTSTLVDYNTTGGSVAVGNIAPFQGFWIKANAAGSFLVNTLWRTASPITTAYNKTGNELRLNVLDDAQKQDQIVFEFDPTAITAFNKETDAFKIFAGTQVPSLYIDNTSEFLSIKQLNTVAPSSKNVGFRFANNSISATISADFTNYTLVYAVYLEDKHTNTLHNLATGPYHFTNQANAPINRFAVHFTSSVGIEDELKTAETKAFYTNGNLAILPQTSGKMHLQISDLTGRILLESEVLGESGDIEYIPFQAFNGVYLVTIQTANKQFITTKIVVAN